MCETRAEGTFILFSQHTDIGFEKHANSVIGYEAHGVLFFLKKKDILIVRDQWTMLVLSFFYIRNKRLSLKGLFLVRHRCGYMALKVLNTEWYSVVCSVAC